MKFEFHDTVVRRHLTEAEIAIWFGGVLLSVIIGPLVVTLAIAIMSALLFLGINYVVDVVTEYPRDAPIIYEIREDHLVINYKNFWERKIALDSVLKLMFRNHRYRKSLYIEFNNEEGRRMGQKTTATFNKGWPQDRWQELFEELHKRCPNAKIVVK